MAENVEKGIRSEILHDESVESGETDVVAGSLLFFLFFSFFSLFFFSSADDERSINAIQFVRLGKSTRPVRYSGRIARSRSWDKELEKGARG